MPSPAARALAVMLAIAGSASGQSPDEPEAKKSPPPAILVPYRDLDRAIEGKGPGVYLPYEEFLELWGRSFPLTPPDLGRPPDRATVSDALLEGVVEESGVKWTATLSVTTHGEGWTEVDLGFAGAALISFDAGGAEGAFVRPGTKGGLVLHLPEAGRHSVTLALAAGVANEGSSRRAALAAPPSAVSRVRLSIGASGIRPEIERAVATAVREEAGATTVMGLLPSGGPVSIRWTPLPPEFAPGTGYLFSEVASSSTVSPLLERVDATISGRVTRAVASSVRVALPPGFSLIDAGGEAVASARVLDGGDVLVDLGGPREAFSFALGLERARPAGEVSLVLAAPSVAGATRETTILEAKPEGPLRLRVDALERAVRVAGGDALRFRTLAPDARVALATIPVVPRVAATLDERLEISDGGKLALRARVALRIAEAGLFEVTLLAPAGFSVEDAGPKDVVREHRAEIDAAGRLAIVLSLAAEARGDVVVEAALRRDADPVAEPFAAPLLTLAGAERQDLVYSIAAEEKLNVKVESAASLDPIDVATLAKDRLPAPPFGTVMAFRTNAPDSASLRLSVERRKTRVTAAARSLVAVEEDRMIVETTTVFTIQYAPVDTLTILVPAALDGTLDLSTPRLKERRRVGPREELPGLVEWTVTLQSPAVGEVHVTTRGEIPLDRPAPGGSVRAAVALIHAEGVERETGHVAVRRAGNLGIEPEATGLEPIDPRELPAELAARDPFLAWRYLATPASLALAVVRHDYEPVVDTAVTRLHADTVVSESGLARSVAYLEVRNTARPYLEAVLPEGSTLLSSDVNGAAARPNRRPGGESLLVPVPLTEDGAGSALVRLLYETRLPGGAVSGLAGTVSVSVPRFPGTPVLKLTLRVYLPEELVVMGFSGSATPLSSRSEFLSWVSGSTLSRLGFDPTPVVLSAAAAARPLEAERQDDARRGERYALDLDIAREGREFLFAKLDGDAVAVIPWASRGFFGLLRFFFALALPVLGIVLVRAGRARRLPFLLVAAAALGVVAPFAPAGLSRLLDSALVGLAAIAVFWGILGALGWMKADAESRRAAGEGAA